ncbi:MAG: hypothetical protein OXJ62_12600 [Spirochaetaceae bacterium]|nr:hypothetical protein [Spirochaetaceae bacterium]
MGGLFRPECALAPWSFGKVVDLAKHRPPPLIVIGTAGMIRVLRATLIDELPKQYVVTARTKGVAETIHARLPSCGLARPYRPLDSLPETAHSGCQARVRRRWPA